MADTDAITEEVSQCLKENDDKQGDNPSMEGLSKRARKKLLSRKAWLDSKAERRAIQRQKRKAKIEENKASGKFDISYSARRKRLKDSRMSDSNCKVNVVIDMNFDGFMNDRDLGKCLKQLLHCYSINRRLSNPMQFHVCGLTGKAEAEMLARHQGFKSWDCNFHNNSYVETFLSEPFSKPKSDIVYLTSESANVIGDTLDPSKVYIIGGLVDHNAHKGLCHKLAVEAGVSHARLPIDEYIDLKTRKVFTIDLVFQILAKVGSENMTWKDAFLSTLPARKGAKDLESDDDDQICSEQDFLPDNAADLKT